MSMCICRSCEYSKECQSRKMIGGTYVGCKKGYNPKKTGRCKFFKQKGVVEDGES